MPDSGVGFFLRSSLSLSFSSALRFLASSR